MSSVHLGARSSKYVDFRPVLKIFMCYVFLYCSVLLLCSVQNLQWYLEK